MIQKIRWGILAPGKISGAFAAALQEAEGVELAAVGSRDLGRARAFADKYGFDRAYGSYAELAADPDVHAVYIGTPHTFHERDTVLCLDNGKHVLCEKPLAINAVQARRMVAAARDNDRLLMEAMWTRFLPSLVHVRKLIDSGTIGAPRTLTADFGFQAADDPAGRLFNPELGGGTLLDLGVYPVSLAHWLFGDPVEIHGAANLGPTGVDDDAGILLRHAGGEMTTAFTSFRVETPRTATIQGTEGWIRLEQPWWGARSITVGLKGREEESQSFDLRGQGYTHMAEAFMDLIREGKRDSDVVPHDQSLAVMETMDALRAGWGQKYPME
jgi:predicted dehydrogenase